MPARLEQLPVEVQISILCHLGTIDAILTVLRASPRLLFVYRTNRNVIYPEIVYRRIPSLVLVAAANALNLRNSGSIEHITTFTKALSATWDRSALSLADWKHLDRAQCVVDDMIIDSVTRAFCIVRRDSSSATSDAFDMSLSPTEYGRLLRAFYNWDRLTSVGAQFINRMSPIDDFDEPSVEPPELQTYRERFQSFCKALAPHEYDDMFFVAHYLRARIFEYLDQVEDEQFEVFHTSGPYKYRHDFEGGDTWIWTGYGRECQDRWAGDTLYSKSLTDVSDTIHETRSGERIKQVEAIKMNSAYGPRAPWRRLEEKLEHQHTLTIADLTSTLLPPGWHSGRLPQLDWAGLEFVDSVESCNLGLLWGCRSPWSDRPDSRLLRQMSIWGASLWDAERLRKMGVLTNSPTDIAKKEHNALTRYRRNDRGYPRRNPYSLEDRVGEMEQEWISKGLTLDEWDFGLGVDRFGNRLCGGELCDSECYCEQNDESVSDAVSDHA